jgi:hypothetical protein
MGNSRLLAISDYRFDSYQAFGELVESVLFFLSWRLHTEPAPKAPKANRPKIEAGSGTGVC